MTKKNEKRQLKDLFIEDLGKATGGKRAVYTTLAVGEEDDPYTTLAVGEEDPVTTLALCEE